MPGEKYGSKTDVVVKLVLVFFIALLSFSIGTFVGKKFSDNQYKLSQLEPQGGHSDEVAANDDSADETATATGTAGAGENRGLASVPANAGDVNPGKALSDDEIAKLASEFVSDDEGAKKSDGKPATAAVGTGATGENAEVAKEGPATHESTAKTESKMNHGNENENAHIAEVSHGNAKTPASVMHEAQPLKPAERMAEGKSAVVANPIKPTSRIPSSLPKETASSAVGKYTVQIAAYLSEKDAQKKAADLKDKGYSAFYVAAKVKNQTWYRVSVGLFTTMKEAEAYKKDLAKNGKITSAMIQTITK